MQEKICEASEFCGGCTLQGIDYQKQLELKQQKADSLLSRLGKVEKILGMDNPRSYRNKIQVSFGSYHNQIFVGNYVKETHQLVPIDGCMLVDETINRIIKSIVKIVNRYQVPVFDQRSGKGTLRHLVVRSSNQDQYMVIIVTGNSYLKEKEKLIEEIARYNPEVTTIIQNINNERTSLVLSDKNITLYGKGYIEDRLCGYSFKISPNSFYQVNKRQTEILYNKAIELAEFNGNEVLIDAYCGTGTIGIASSKKVKKVLAVELNRQAIGDAKENARRNNIDNIEFVCDDAGEYMAKLANTDIKIDAVIMDPPRAGADNRFLNSLILLAPKKIVYISCNPITQRDNLGYLCKKGYVVEKLQPVDMFPYTDHVENIAFLVRK